MEKNGIISIDKTTFCQGVHYEEIIYCAACRYYYKTTQTTAYDSGTACCRNRNQPFLSFTYGEGYFTGRSLMNNSVISKCNTSPRASNCSIDGIKSCFSITIKDRNRRNWLCRIVHRHAACTAQSCDRC